MLCNCSHAEYSTLTYQDSNLDLRSFDEIFAFIAAETLRTLEQMDVAGKGTLEKPELRKVLVSAVATTKYSHLKVHSIREMIDACLEGYSEKDINYQEVLHKMDWQRNPIRPIVPKPIPVSSTNTQGKRLTK